MTGLLSQEFAGDGLRSLESEPPPVQSNLNQPRKGWAERNYHTPANGNVKRNISRNGKRRRPGSSHHEEASDIEDGRF
jgi:hypothetical protein